MSKQNPQNYRSRRLASRTIGLVIVLALIFLQQAWAAALCTCDHDNKPQAEVSHCNRHKAAPAGQFDSTMHAEMDHASMHHHSGSAMHVQSAMREETAGDTRETIQSEAGTRVADGQSNNPQPIDLPAVSFSAQQEPLEFESAPLPLDSSPQIALHSLKLFKPPRSRPVYLTVSSLLI
jgi:hypothetical protein